MSKQFPRIHHIRVLDQVEPYLCGFHCYFNAKCILWSIVSDSEYDVAYHLSAINTPTRFQKCYLDAIKKIENSQNPYYIGDLEKKKIYKGNPLERNMLRYLLMFDPEINAIKNNSKDIKVFMRPYFMGFGLIQMTPDQVRQFQDELEQFHKSESEAVFVIFIGALNHWVTLVVHKRFV